MEVEVRCKCGRLVITVINIYPSLSDSNLTEIQATCPICGDQVTATNISGART